MIGRREFGLAGISAAALVAWESSGLAQTKAEHAEHHHDVDKCAVACGACQRSCDSCSTHCADLAASGKKEHLESLKSCQDCAAICATASQIVSRGGPFADLICTACAEACARCAKICELFPDDNHMKLCAAECRKCEAECRAMLKRGAAAETKKKP